METTRPSPPEKMAASLEFVSITHPDDMKDRTTRRKVSRHVMKDIGMSRRRTKSVQRKHGPDPISKQSSDDKPGKMVAQNKNDGCNPGQEQARDPFQIPPFTTLSRNLAARAKRIERFLTRPDNPMCMKLRELCFTIAMVDDSAMYMALADVAVYEIGGCSKPLLLENPLSLGYYTSSLRLVSEKIKTSESSICHGIIGTIVGIASYDIGVRNHRRWATHMDGLKTLVDTKGGLQALNSTYVLNGVIWADIVGSVALDTVPRFVSPRQVTNRVHEYEAPDLLLKMTSTLNCRTSEFLPVCSALQSLSELASLSSRVLPTKWLGDENIVQASVRAAYEILLLPRYHVPGLASDTTFQHAAMQELIRLASTLFLIGPITEMAGDHEFELSYLGKIPNLLRTVEMDWTGLEELELWVLILGALAESGDNREWLVSRVLQRLEKHNLNWDGMFQSLRSIAWIDGAFPVKLSRLAEDWKRYTDLSTV